MKKILLATTILGMSAGFAAAEVGFTGAAQMGVASDAGGDFMAYTSIELSIAMTGESDSGLSFGANTSISAGSRTYTFGPDDGFGSNDGTMGNPEVWISGGFGKLAMKTDGYKEFHADTNEVFDVDYSATFGAASVGLRADIEGGAMSGKLGYAANNLSANLNADDTGDWDVSLGYTMGSLTATVSTNHDNLSALKLEYAANGISGSVKFDTDSFWEIAAGYEANSIAVNLSTDADNAWSVDASYDLGGGLSVWAGTNYTSDAVLGAKMSF